MSCRNPRLLVRISPAKVAPIASTATKTLMSSTLILRPNPFGPISHAPKKDQLAALTLHGFSLTEDLNRRKQQSGNGDLSQQHLIHDSVDLAA